MNVFDLNLKGKKIIKIFRCDVLGSYNYQNPQGVFLMFEEDNGLFIRHGESKNQTNTIDVRVTSYEDMYEFIRYYMV